MAKFKFRCPKCGNRYELEYPLGTAVSETSQICPKCGFTGRATRIYDPPSIAFVGSGFATNDLKNRI